MIDREVNKKGDFTMKKLILGCALIFCLLFTTSALAISVTDFDGEWSAETVYYEGVALPADIFGFDMEVSIATTNMGAIVEVDSVAMEMDTHDIFEFINDELVLEGISRFVYEDDSHIHLYMDADGDSTYIVLARNGDEVVSEEVIPEQTPIPVAISESAKDVVVTGTDKIVVSDWGLVQEDYRNYLVLALTNISNETIPDIDLQIIFYNENGGIIAIEDDEHDVVLSGSTVVTTKRIGDEALNYASVEVAIDTERYTNTYTNHAESLDIVGDVSGDNVFLQVTNNAKKTISEVEIVVVYYKNGVIAGVDDDEVYDLAVGKKHIFEFSGYKTCGADEYKVFINQAHTWW